MTMWTLFLLCCAGGVGASARFLSDSGVRYLLRGVSDKPGWAGAETGGIVLVNMLGSFLAGVAFGASLASGYAEIAALLGAFLSGYTTFSTAMVDVLKLRARGLRWRATALWVGTFILCLGCAYLGVVLG